MLTDLLRHGVLIVDGEEHDRYRELMEPPLHPSKLPNYTDMMLAKTDHVSSQWESGCVGRYPSHPDSHPESHRPHLTGTMDLLAEDATLRIWQTVEDAG